MQHAWYVHVVMHVMRVFSACIHVRTSADTLRHDNCDTHVALRLHKIDRDMMLSLVNVSLLHVCEHQSFH